MKCVTKSRRLPYGLIFLLLTVSVTVNAQQLQEIRKSIYFGGGDYRVDSVQAEALHQWLDSIPNLEKYEVQLISHTDPIGGKEYNAWLSNMRSETVKQLILQQPIPEHKISIKDWGLDNAVYTNRTRRGMKLNRRVDVILLPLVL
jgi:outer membrane protein OmpA-like peptidoglycan-associated protein